MMLNSNDEGGAAQQEAESQAFGNDLRDSPRDIVSFAGISNAMDSLHDELDAMALRLGARTREFTKSGEFSNAHDASLERRQERHSALEARLVAAIRRGAIWQSIRLELERDFDTLFGNFGHLMDRMDAEAMKGRF
jgi:hypothetical protein